VRFAFLNHAGAYTALFFAKTDDRAAQVIEAAFGKALTME
jgi:hypothetical protein